MASINDAFRAIRAAASDESKNRAVEHIRSFAYTFACTQLRLPHDRADEVANDTAAKALSVAETKTFDNEASAAAYLKAIIRSRAGNAARSDRRRRTSESPEGQDIVESSPGKDSDEDHLRAELVDRIGAYGRAVHGTTRFSAFTAYCLSWISLTGAAQRLGRSKSLVGRQFSRMRDWVRRTFGADRGN